MHGASPDPFVLEIRELARLIALAREWVLCGAPGARAEIRARRAAERAARFSRSPPPSAAARSAG